MLNLLSDLSIIECIVLAVFAIAFLTQLFYFLFFYTRIAFHQKKSPKNNTMPVSLIISAKNEEKNLRKLIPVLMEQKYPDFELVIINDGSWDDTYETLEAFKLTYPSIHIVDIPEEGMRMKGKKFALTLGIKGSKHDRLLFTDADCIPNSLDWISEMMSVIEDENDIVLGYSPYSTSKGFLNKIIRFETLTTGIQYLSFAKAGIPYMGVGRNLSYNKNSFFEIGGFRKHSFLQSGDDDLFVNQIANKNNTRIQIDKSTHQVSEPKEIFKDWWHQKRRHFSTATHYKGLHKFLLGLIPLSYYLLFLSAIVLLCLQTFPLLVISLLGFRVLIQITIFKLSSRHLGDDQITWLGPFWELVLMTLNPMIYLSILINKPKEWN